MNVAVVKYNAGNVKSLEYALNRLGINAILTDNHEEIKSADKVIFPGVGCSNATMPYLIEKKLDKLIINLKQPVLGICLGMQLMCSHSEEGDVDCLGIFDSTVKRFYSINQEQFKIPHMGWNNLENVQTCLFESFESNPYVYFVHSYYVPLCENTIATVNHIQDFTAAINKDNFWGVQFHPEKSGSFGEDIIRNFINL